MVMTGSLVMLFCFFVFSFEGGHFGVHQCFTMSSDIGVAFTDPIFHSHESLLGIGFELAFLGASGRCKRGSPATEYCLHKQWIARVDFGPIVTVGNKEISTLFMLAEYGT